MRQLLLLLLTVFVSINAGGVCPPEDLSGDCVVGVADLAILADQWLDPAGCIEHPDDCADFIGNDGVTLEDFSVLAAEWGVVGTPPAGSLTVTLEPAGAIAAGALWRVDSGIWHVSGYTQTGLAIGSHTVSYSTVSDWDTPGDQVVQINDGATTTTTGTYIEQVVNLPTVVINEIHYNPDLPYELVEFVELYNAGTESIDLSGWYFSDGIAYTFPPGTSIAAGEYIVITEDASVRTISPTTSVHDKYGTSNNLIYGPFSGGLSNEGETIELRTADGIEVDQVDYQLGFPWPTVGDEIPEGSYGNGHSIQLVNPDLDNDLAGSWRSAYPTPGAANTAVYASNIPPQIRQVEHTPQSPMESDIVAVTAKVTDSDGVVSVTLQYQVVEPGNYIALQDAAYNNWTSLAMHDDGLNGDRFSGDAVHCVQLPAATRVHRTLIRYRITAEDAAGRSVTVPYADDPQPNFAYFVYNGVPAWSGADQPGTTPVVEYDQEVMNSLPVYHLISKNSDVEDCTWYSRYGGSDYLWYGTMIYDGQVYDHIRYRARGGVWRYAMGKNMWKFDFNRGHYFQARDDYGDKYKEKWDKLNFSACIQQGDYGHRGEQGIFEAAGFRMFNMMGVEAPHTNWLQFRIIDETDENGTTQYDGDLWGLYLAIEQMDGRFLDEHKRLDGNLYKIEDYNGTLNNQGPTQPINGFDYTAFRSNWYNASTKPAESWWRQNVDLDRYYDYRCVVEGIHHGDIAYGKNYFFYNDAQANIWTMYPWDLDLTWANNMYGDGQEPFINYYHGAIFSTNSQLLVEYNNRLREFHDLFYNTDQLYSLLDELGSIIDHPDGGLSIVDVDRAMWDYNPVMADSSIVNLSKAGQGRFYQAAATNDFPGMIQIMKDYITGYRSFNTYSEDPDVPATPAVTYLGDPNYPENDLRFQTSAYSDPQGSETFAAMKWRIAEVEPYTEPVTNSVRLVDQESDWQYFKGYGEPSDPVDAWRLVDFDDSSWETGQGPIGYGESVVNTTLDDMRGNYTAVYLRKTFYVSNPDDFETLTVGVLYDDGYNLWINGTLVASNNVAGSELAYYETADNAIEPGDYELTTVDPSGCLVTGTNVIAIQVLNADLKNSSDCVIDAMLEVGGSSGGNQFVFTGKPGKYEIEPIWESAELTTFNSDIQIPADGVKPGRTYRVRCRMKDDTGRWSHWSDPIHFVAGEAKDADILSYLRVTELMYNNGGADFIELKNISTTATLDLSNVSITSGVAFSFAGSNVTTLAPGDFVLVVKDPNTFEAQYGAGLDNKIAGAFVDSSLSNSGETIKIEDTWNGTIIEFEYDDARGWPLAADGAGHSLVPLSLTIEDQPLGTLDFGGNWRQSAYIGGSPGIDDPSPLTGVVINEIMAHTDLIDENYPDYDSNDWIELYNTSDSDVNLNGDWYLSDDTDNLKKWALPPHTLTSGGWVSFDEITGFHSPITSGFGLDKAGEQIYLSYLPGTSADRVVDCVRFKGQENYISLSRYPDGDIYWFHTPPTMDAANSNPAGHVVISEIMYHPQPDTDTQTYDEYIELYNPSTSSIDLWTLTGPWALDGGVDYEFPLNTTLSSGDRILVVDFDPFTETARLDAFETAYGTANLTPGVDIFGPWSGDLSNNGERVALEKPQDSDDPLDPTAISWIIVDECIYNDYWPWPMGTDGTGLALRRLSSDATASGNNAANWEASSPSPGL